VLDVIALAKKARKYVKKSDEYISLKKIKENKRNNRKRDKEMKRAFKELLKSIDRLANKFDSSIEEVASINQEKARGMWTKNKRKPARYFDKKHPTHEKLPRNFEINSRL
jgi:predicted nuclease with TOPRIM domain